MQGGDGLQSHEVDKAKNRDNEPGDQPMLLDGQFTVWLCCLI